MVFYFFKYQTLIFHTREIVASNTTQALRYRTISEGSSISRENAKGGNLIGWVRIEAWENRVAMKTDSPVTEFRYSSKPLCCVLNLCIAPFKRTNSSIKICNNGSSKLKE